MKNIFHCNSIRGRDIAINVCTCHAKWYFYHITKNCDEKPVYEMGPWIIWPPKAQIFKSQSLFNFCHEQCCVTIRYVTLVTITGTTILMLHLWVNMLSISWRSGTSNYVHMRRSGTSSYVHMSSWFMFTPKLQEMSSTIDICWKYKPQ